MSPRVLISMHFEKEACAECRLASKRWRWVSAVHVLRLETSLNHTFVNGLRICWSRSLLHHVNRCTRERNGNTSIRKKSDAGGINESRRVRAYACHFFDSLFLLTDRFLKGSGYPRESNPQLCPSRRNVPWSSLLSHRCKRLNDYWTMTEVYTLLTIISYSRSCIVPRSWPVVT